MTNIIISWPSDKKKFAPGELASQAEGLLEQFDFDKVRKAMRAVDWVWCFSKSKTGVPSVNELKKAAKELLDEVASKAGKEAFWIGSGGLRVNYSPYLGLSLEFILEEVYTDEDGEQY